MHTTSLFILSILSACSMLFFLTIPFFDFLPTHTPLILCLFGLFFTLVYSVINRNTINNPLHFSNLPRNLLLILFFSILTIDIIKQNHFLSFKILEYYWVIPIIVIGKLVSITKNNNLKIFSFLASISLLALLVILKVIYFEYLPESLAYWRHFSPEFASEVTATFNSIKTNDLDLTTLALTLPIPLTVLLSNSKFNYQAKSPMLIATTLILLALALAGLRIALLISAIGISLSLLFTNNKRTFLVFLLFSLFFFIYIPSKDNRSSYGESLSKKQRQELLQTRFEIFKDHFFFGAGTTKSTKLIPIYNQKIGIKNGLITDAPNTYVQLLSTVGISGFVVYMLFIILTLFSNLRLLNEIPNSHYWYQVFTLGFLIVQINFHVLGLFQWTLTFSQPLFIYILTIALMSHFARNYANGIVPDDQSL